MLYTVFVVNDIYYNVIIMCDCIKTVAQWIASLFALNTLYTVFLRY